MSDEAHEFIHVDASPERCFTLAATFEDYPQWATDVKAVQVLARDEAGRGTRVEYQAAALGKNIRYVLDYDFTLAPRAFSWSLVEGEMLRALEGEYEFVPEDGGTRVDYTLSVELAIPMPGLLKRKASGRIVGAALHDLKRTVERA
jgi:hypothetical protein